MHQTNLRKVGGSVMLAVPPAILELLQLHAGETVGVSVDAGRLIVEPHPQPEYTLEMLLEGFEPGLTEDRGWLDSPAVGREFL